MTLPRSPLARIVVCRSRGGHGPCDRARAAAEATGQVAVVVAHPHARHAGPAVSVFFAPSATLTEYGRRRADDLVATAMLAGWIGPGGLGVAFQNELHLTRVPWAVMNALVADLLRWLAEPGVVNGGVDG